MANGFWNDLPCDNLAPFACKMEATTEGSDPSLPETTTQAKIQKYKNTSLPETTTQAGSHNCGHWSQGWTEDPETGMCYTLLDARLR